VFDFDSVHLIQCCRKMNDGHDWAGNELDGATDFFVGAVVTPESDPIEPQMYKFARKVEAGADFFQTQAVYDMDNFQRFMEQAREITAGTSAKIMAGLVVLTSLGMAKFMNRAVPGIFVPDRAWRSPPATFASCVRTRSATACTSWPSAKRRSSPRSSTWPA
jgi:methylenetetrahydrofolate reductase (NADPH)